MSNGYRVHLLAPCPFLILLRSVVKKESNTLVAKKDTLNEAVVTQVADTLKDKGEVVVEKPGATPYTGHTFSFDAYTNPLESIKAALSEPFPEELISYRDGAWNKQTKQRDQLRYVNVRHYEDRLNKVAYGHWSRSEVTVLPVQEWKDVTVYNAATGKSEKTGEKFEEHGYIATVYVSIYGTTHTGISDFDTMATGADSTAFKRACLPFGLGRELYEKEEVQQASNPQSSYSGNSTQSTGTRSTPTGTAKASDGGYPRPTEGQIKFLARLGVPASLLELKQGENYVITGNIGRDLIDGLKEGGAFEGDPATALALHGITLPAPTRNNGDGLPVRSGYVRR
jgi:hypothetical protein